MCELVVHLHGCLLPAWSGPKHSLKICIAFFPNLFEVVQFQFVVSKRNRDCILV